jgi:hypothetical protein
MNIYIIVSSLVASILSAPAPEPLFINASGFRLFSPDQNSNNISINQGSGNINMPSYGQGSFNPFQLFNPYDSYGSYFGNPQNRRGYNPAYHGHGTNPTGQAGVSK